jgi:hypothetical protein
MNIRNTVIILLLFTAHAVAQTLQERQAFTKLAPDQQVTVQTWLNKNCGAAEQKKFEIKLSQLGSVLEPVFWEAFHLGPTEQDLKIVSASAIKRYQDRNQWLRQFGDIQMGKEETQRQLAITEKQYVESEINQYTERYKTAALSGVGLIGSVQSEAELKQIANEPDNPAQTAAQETLKLINQNRKY